MKLSQPEKRIKRTLTNLKEIIQKSRNVDAPKWARLTRGQESEAWALYKSNSSQVSWGGLSRDPYITVACPKLFSPAVNTFVEGIVYLRQSDSVDWDWPQRLAGSIPDSILRVFKKKPWAGQRYSLCTACMQVGRPSRSAGDLVKL